MIISLLQPLHDELYTLDPERFFVSSFLDAVKDGSETALRRILTEHSPGVFTFNMLKPSFCAKMLEEVCISFSIIIVSNACCQRVRTSDAIVYSVALSIFWCGFRG